MQLRKLHKFHKEIHKEICDSLKKKAERQIQGENLEVAREKRLSICKKFNKGVKDGSYKKIFKERKVNFVPLGKREYVRMKYFEVGEGITTQQTVTFTQKFLLFLVSGTRWASTVACLSQGLK